MGTVGVSSSGASLLLQGFESWSFQGLPALLCRVQFVTLFQTGSAVAIICRRFLMGLVSRSPWGRNGVWCSYRTVCFQTSGVLLVGLSIQFFGVYGVRQLLHAMQFPLLLWWFAVANCCRHIVMAPLWVICFMLQMPCVPELRRGAVDGYVIRSSLVRLLWRLVTYNILGMLLGVGVVQFENGLDQD
ncbi:uncharacterized protein LOC116920347 isoform X3 [Daphnia magna]|uniref:uncharacterized protein LOC116920347 isoform X3 n=1 Tax=Daphnia magna TaxID=35525 RepID=UPI001E1BBE3B|nr:uncharacterized protein LOC116920347 isoform X3 [Daphnia magna]